MLTTLAAQHRAFIQAEINVRVDVYRDHPQWDQCERWWHMPHELRRELFVGRYECHEDDEDRMLALLEDEYPGHVFLYA